jgi:hypothetical protein
VRDIAASQRTQRSACGIVAGTTRSQLRHRRRHSSSRPGADANIRRVSQGRRSGCRNIRGGCTACRPVAECAGR